MNKLLDLRFVIGLFFTIVGIMLLVYGLMASGDGNSLNRWCGIVFIIFGVFMIILSFQKDASDEILDH
jgi:uncharacterized membrane protein